MKPAVYFVAAPKYTGSGVRQVLSNLIDILFQTSG